MNAKELTVRADVKRWTQCVRRDIADFVSVDSQLVYSQGPPSEAEQSMTIRAVHAMDRIWGDAAHWYKAVTSDELPVNIRQEIEAGLDGEVREIVRNMRNITEHWDENRRYFEDPTLPGAPKSVRWYQAQDLVNGPWSWSWVYGRGHELGDVLRLDRLLAEVTKAESILAANPLESTVFGQTAATCHKANQVAGQ